jgi:bifunctional non-homologous end joining protein LigD
MPAKPKKFEISNPGKVLFPKSGITKQELIDYYTLAGPYMLPYLKDRPVSLQRYPEGINGESFFQKEVPHYFPKYIDRTNVNDPDEPVKEDAIINNIESLLYIVNLASIPIHTWQSRKKKLNYPDQVIWDLDPSVDDFESVRTGAKLLRYMLEELGMKVWLKTSGSKGLHLTVPIKPEFTYTEVKQFTRSVSEYMAAKIPQLFTTEIRKNKREGKILIDFLRNGYGHTAVVAYSVRPIENAPVAAPITWEELDKKDFHPQYFNIRNMPARFKKIGDLWEGFYSQAKSLKAPMKKMDAILSGSRSLQRVI